MKKNVAGQIVGAQMTSATDGSDFTGAVTVYVTGNGGTQAVGSVGSGACTHEGNGFHTYAPSQAETNYDHVGFTFKGTGAVTATVQLYPNFPQSGDAFGLIGATGSGLTSLANATDQTAIKTKTDLLPSAAPGAAGGLLIAGANAAITANITGNITGNVSGSVGSVTGAVGSVTGAVGSVVAGVTLAAATHTGAVIPTVTNLSNLPAIPAGWLTAAGIAAGALNGKGDWNIGKTGYSLTQGFPTNFASMSISVAGLVDIAQAAADKVWGSAARVLTSGANIALAKGSGITGFNDLDAAGVASATWNAATASYNGAGSFGALIQTNLDAKVSTAVGAGFTAADVADAVWDELLSGHAISGSAGAGLASAGAAGDPLANNVPGSYAAGTAGYLLGTNLDAKVSGRAMQTSVDAIKAKTDNLPSAAPGAAGGVFIAGSNAATTVNITGTIDTVTTLTNKTGFSLSAAGIQAIWDALTSALTTAGSIGKKLTDWLAAPYVDTYTGNTKQTGDAFARLGAPAGASLSADVAAVKADSASISARIPAALVSGMMNANLGAIDASTTALAQFKRGVKGNVYGTVGAGSTTGSIVTSSMTPAGSVTDKFKGRILIFADDTTTVNLRGQATDITGVTSAANPTLTVTPLTTAPVSTDTFVIV